VVAIVEAEKEIREEALENLPLRPQPAGPRENQGLSVFHLGRENTVRRRPRAGVATPPSSRVAPRSLAGCPEVLAESVSPPCQLPPRLADRDRVPGRGVRQL